MVSPAVRKRVNMAIIARLEILNIEDMLTSYLSAQMIG